MTQTISVPMQDIPKPLSLSDAVGKWTQINNQQAAGQLAQQQETRLADQNQRENKMGELKFNVTQQAGLKDAMTSYKSALQTQAAKLGIQPNTPQYQQLANATYHNGGYDKLVQNMGGHAHDPKTDIDLSAVEAVAGMTLAEQNAADIQQKVAESNALLPNKIAVAEAMSGINAKQDERNFQQSKELAGINHNYAIDTAKQQFGWKKELEQLDDMGGITDEAATENAIAINRGAPMPRLGKDALIKISNRRAQLNSDNSVTPEQAALNQVLGKSDADSIKAQRILTDKVFNSERTFRANLTSYKDSIKNLANSTSPVIQRWIQTGERGAGLEPELAAAGVYNKEVVNEFAKLVSGSPSGGGATALAEIEEASKLLTPQMTYDQMMAAASAMEKSTDNRMNALNENMGKMQERYKSQGSGVETEKSNTKTEKAPPAGYQYLIDPQTGKPEADPKTGQLSIMRIK